MINKKQQFIPSLYTDWYQVEYCERCKKMKMLRIGSMLDPTISFKISCKDSLYTLAKIFCLQTMHTGVNKQVPNNSSIEFYQTVMEGIRIYHNTVLSGVEVGHSKLALLPKVLLNKNNITTT